MASNKLNDSDIKRGGERISVFKSDVGVDDDVSLIPGSLVSTLLSKCTQYCVDIVGLLGSSARC